MPFMYQWEDSSLAVSVKYQVPLLRPQHEKVREIIYHYQTQLESSIMEL